jgi:hypothetical protein
MLISTPDNTATVYLDDTPLGSVALDGVPSISTLNWYLMVNLAMGGGWPDNSPPAGYYDMWIDYVRYYN